MNSNAHSARTAVIVGPQGVGKTTLLGEIVKRAGSPPPAFDTSSEAKEFGMTVEPNFARISYLGETWTIIDCPGSVELFESSVEPMRVADIVILAAPASADRGSALAPYLNFLDANSIPHVVFVNRIDELNSRFKDLLEAMQLQSTRPLVLRQAPLRENGKIIGAVDLVSERAWRYREGASSDLVELPESDRPAEKKAREEMLDALADFDDALLEQLLEDKAPPQSDIFHLMEKELREDLIVPVTLGSAAHGHGVTRLLKLLRHEAPNVDAAAARRSVQGDVCASVIKTLYAPHIGKLSMTRIWKGEIRDGAAIDGARLSGAFYLHGDMRIKADVAKAGDVVCLPKIEKLETGDMLADGSIIKHGRAAGGDALYAAAVNANSERDEVKLSAALHKLVEEDGSLLVERGGDSGETVLVGCGDVHLRLTAAKLRNRHNVEITMRPPKAAYRETIKGSADHHARHKKQSGGHGQFADIKVRVKPMPRGGGFQFDEAIHGGSVPRQYIPAVEAGVKEELIRGPLGFPVVDISVTLYDGQHHSVDSNEMSFKLAGRQAMREALPDCEPILLEPIHSTVVHAPTAYASKVRSLLSSRRGQILGFDSRGGWPGWESVNAMMPEASLRDLIIELRSITQGVATFEAKFDHYQELHGKEAEKILIERRRELEN